MKVTHIISSLEIGGANMMLYKLMTGGDRERFEQSVVVLSDKGRLGPAIEAEGLPVYAINMALGRPSLSALWRLRRQVQQLGPDLIMGWTYHSNIAASLVSKLLPSVPLLWNIRHTPYDLNSYKRLTYVLIRYGKWLSRGPAGIIYNSNTSLEKHRQLGYAGKREIVLPNGFDVEQFKPSPAARSALRAALNLAPDTPLIGMVARYHAMKDHAAFLQAAAHLAQSHPEVHYVLIGREVDANNPALQAQVNALGLQQQVHLLGERLDMAEITAALDIASLTSAWGDAFPNVVGEAMACGIPCVVTDIGDAAEIVRDTGIVVPPQQPLRLAQGWQQLLEMPSAQRAQLGQAARQRVIECFSLPGVVRQYQDLYLDIQAAAA